MTVDDLDAAAFDEGVSDPERREGGATTERSRREQAEARAGDGQASTESGNVSDSTIITTGVYSHTEYNYQVFADHGDSAPWRRDLGRDDFEVFSLDQLLTIDKTIVAPEPEVERVVLALSRRRVALIAGERGLGKAAIAHVAAGRIALLDSSLREALVATGPDARVRVKPEALFDERKGLLRSVVVLEDALDGGNEDLNRLVERLDEPRLNILCQRLETTGSYLIVTIDVDRHSGKTQRLEPLGVLVQVGPPPTEILLNLLRRLAARPVGRDHPHRSDADPECKGVIETGGEYLAGRLRTLPRAAEWVTRFLDAVAQGELTLTESLDRLDNRELWLLDELPRNPPVWHFVLALALASPSPRSDGIPWLLMHRMWREVEGLIEKELGQGEEPRPRPMSRLTVNRDFLACARAEIRRSPMPMGDAVRFEEPIIAEQTWRVLLGSGRPILAVLRPRLRELVDSRERPISVVAARALGRLGEMDPSGLMLPEIDARLRPRREDAHFEHPLLLGEMLVGALSSDDPTYVAACLDRLRRATGDKSVERAEAAMVAFVPIGAALPVPVLEILWQVAQSRIGDKTMVSGPLWRTVRDRVDRPTRPDGAEIKGTPSRRDLERAALEVLGDRAAKLLDALQFSLVGICFSGDPLFRVLGAMTQWMGSGESVAPWIAFLTLRHRGLLHVLEDFPLRPPVDGGTGAACSRIVLGADEEDEVATVARFLEAAHTGAGAFPSALRGSLRGKLVAVVDGWISQGAEVPVVRPQVIALLTRLLDAGEEILRSEVFKVLQVRSTGDDHARRELAREALRGL